MTKINNTLASRLIYLPLDIHEKVLLWLTYKGLKPVSEITVERRGNLKTLLRKGIKPKTNYDPNSIKTKRIKNWIRDAGMYYVVEPEFETSWHVSLHKDKAILSSKIIRKFDYENEIRSGQLFGYPKNSTEIYAKNREKSYEEIMKTMVGTGDHLYNNPYLKNKYYTPYIFYNMPKNSVIEDSKVAQKWADLIRKDVPTLAKWFEDKEKKKRGGHKSIAHEFN